MILLIPMTIWRWKRWLVIHILCNSKGSMYFLDFELSEHFQKFNRHTMNARTYFVCLDLIAFIFSLKKGRLSLNMNYRTKLRTQCNIRNSIAYYSLKSPDPFQQCKTPKWLIFADDDTVIEKDTLNQYIDSLQDTNRPHCLGGLLHWNSGVIRSSDWFRKVLFYDTWEKYQVTKEQYRTKGWTLSKQKSGWT